MRSSQNSPGHLLTYRLSNDKEIEVFTSTDIPGCASLLNAQGSKPFIDIFPSIISISLRKSCHRSYSHVSLAEFNQCLVPVTPMIVSVLSQKPAIYFALTYATFNPQDCRAKNSLRRNTHTGMRHYSHSSLIIYALNMIAGTAATVECVCSLFTSDMQFIYAFCVRWKVYESTCMFPLNWFLIPRKGKKMNSQLSFFCFWNPPLLLWAGVLQNYVPLSHLMRQ